MCVCVSEYVCVRQSVCVRGCVCVYEERELETRDSGILASSLGCSLDSLELLTSCLHVIPALHYRRAFAHLVYLVLGMHPRASSLTGSLPPKQHPGWESFIYLKDFNLLYVYACVSLRVTACVQESWEAPTQHPIPPLE